MKVLQKLMDARLQLQATKLKKSGHNKFANYYYFELADFLPTIQSIFKQHGLCGLVSFGSDLASLTIYDTETGENVVITSPMSTAALKGCHEVQNLGAVETYIRRYLWVTALEIVEHDAIDSVTQTDPVPKEKQSFPKAEQALRKCQNLQELAAVWAKLSDDQRSSLADVKNEMKEKLS